MDMNYSHAWFEHKVPSPSGSEDSGLGWSPNSQTSDYRFQLGSPNSGIGYGETENAYSPQNFSDFKDQLKPNDDFDLLKMLDQKPDVRIAQVQNKKTSGKATKKKNLNESAQSSKLERCFLPKTGNGKPRQTSVKRKPSQKNSTAYPYPGVRVLTVREKLKKMRASRTGPNGKSSPNLQQQTDVTNSYNNQPFPQPLPTTTPLQFQQGFSHIPTQEIFPTPPMQATNFIQAPMTSSFGNTSPLHHDPPNYTSASLVSSPDMQFELDSGEVDRLAEPYPQSLASNSPYHGSQCSSPQQFPHSPELSPAVQQVIHSPGPQYSDVKSPVNYGLRNTVANPCSPYAVESAVSFPSPNYGSKVPLQSSFAVGEYPYEGAESIPFENQCNFDVQALCQNIRRGAQEQVCTLLTYKSQCIDASDENGKSAIFHAIESGQLDMVKILINFQAKLTNQTTDGKNVLHFAAALKNNHILELLLLSLQPAEKQMLLKASCKRGCTPLHAAAEAKNTNGLMKMLECGANYLAQDNNGYSPLHVVVKNGGTMMMRVLIDFAKRSSQALLGNNKLMEMVCQPALDGTTPLHIAAELHRHGIDSQKQYEIVQLLMECGANPHASNADGKSPEQLLPLHTSSLQAMKMFRLMNPACYGVDVVEMYQPQMSCAAPMPHIGQFDSVFRSLSQ